MNSFGRWSAMLVVTTALLVTACTSKSPSQTASAGSGARGGLAANNDSATSTVGITDDAINIAFIGVDFSALASTGLVPDLGDQQKQVQAVVDDINAGGGINGRRINLHFKLLNGITGGADATQAACIEATQEFKAAVVILPPAASRDLARCTAVTNKTLTIYATGMDSGLYTEAQGRLFTPDGISIDRQMRGWADEMNKEGLLDGKTVGVAAGDAPQEFTNGVNQSLLPELEKLNHKSAQTVVLPCPQTGATSTSCDQYDVAAQKLKDANVDTVFMTLANTFGTGLIQAADNIGYHPKWLLEGNQTTDTVLKFFDSVKGSLAGAVGMGFGFKDASQVGTDCNKIVTDRSGEVYQPGSDAFGFAAVVCNEFRYVDTSGDKIDKAKLNQGALISGIEGLGTVPLAVGNEQGTLSPTKHDGLNHMYVCDVDGTTGKCVQRPGDLIPIPD